LAWAIPTGITSIASTSAPLQIVSASVPRFGRIAVLLSWSFDLYEIQHRHPLRVPTPNEEKWSNAIFR
jgi:hypothetical protein